MQAQPAAVQAPAPQAILPPIHFPPVPLSERLHIPQAAAATGQASPAQATAQLFAPAPPAPRVPAAAPVRLASALAVPRPTIPTFLGNRFPSVQRPAMAGVAAAHSMRATAAAAAAASPASSLPHPPHPSPLVGYSSIRPHAQVRNMPSSPPPHQQPTSLGWHTKSTACVLRAGTAAGATTSQPCPSRGLQLQHASG